MKVVITTELPILSWRVCDNGTIIATGNSEVMYSLPEEMLSKEARVVLSEYKIRPPRSDTVTFVEHDTHPYYVSER